jgi:hypothetical protein
MFRWKTKQSPGKRLQLQRKVVPFVAVEMSFPFEELRLTDHFCGRKDFLPAELSLAF